MLPLKLLLKFLLPITFIIGPLFFYLKSQMREAKEGQTAIADSLRIQQDIIAILATDKPRNSDNLAQLNQVADYIKKEFTKISDSTTEQLFTVDNKEYKNIILSLHTDKKERIIIGAHYDVCGDQDGADDNASGVAGLLELARMLKGQVLNYRIDLVAYSLEEPPYFATDKMGSYIHAKYLHDHQIPVKGMISLEMIGYFSDKENSQSYPIPLLKYVYGDKGDFITIVQKFNAGDFAKEISSQILSNPSIKTVVFQAPKSLQGIDFSDHRNYWDFGYSSIMITNTAFYRNKNYHEPTDTIETLQMNKIGLVIDQLYRALLMLK